MSMGALSGTGMGEAGVGSRGMIKAFRLPREVGIRGGCRWHPVSSAEPDQVCRGHQVSLSRQPFVSRALSDDTLVSPKGAAFETRDFRFLNRGFLIGLVTILASLAPCCGLAALEGTSASLRRPLPSSRHP